MITLPQKNSHNPHARIPQNGIIAEKTAAEMYVVAAMLKIEGLKLPGKVLVRLMVLALKVKCYFLSLHPNISFYPP